MTGTPFVNMHPWDQIPLLDRDGAHRDPESIAAAWGDERSRVLLVDRSSRFGIAPFGIPTQGEYDGHTAYLGRVDGTCWFARRVDELPTGRMIRDEPPDAANTQLVMAALAVLAWHESMTHCPVCGGTVRLASGGFSALCRECNREHFPRTDPAVIVGVLDDDDRLFLAHQTSWAQWRASVLAGFVEAGESAENALHREVSEEAGVRLSAVRYLGSQPWPFPRSLMLAFVARGYGGHEVDHAELQWGGWFTREEVEARTAEGTLVLPGIGSVAARIIDAWRIGRLPVPEENYWADIDAELVVRTGERF